MKAKKVLSAVSALACALTALACTILLCMQGEAVYAATDGAEEAGAALPLLAAALPTGGIIALALLAVILVAVGIDVACMFISKKKKPAKKSAKVKPERKEPKRAAAEEAKAPAKEEEREVGATAAPEKAASATEVEPVISEVDEEAEREAEAALEEDGEEDDGGISLKESLALAAAHARIKINKSSVAKWLKENYGGEVTLNCRANRTKTGLPLADTHYVTEGAKRKCFAYVYELGEDKSMLLLKTDDETAAKIAEKHPGFVRSRFPKSRRDKWYTLIPDSGFDSADEVFDVIALVLSNYTDSLRQVSEDVRREIARLEKLKKSNVTAEEAKALVSDEAAGVLVAGKRHRRSGKKFAVNIDTLSENYEAEDTVDMDSLKQKGIVPKNASQVKILARGTLDKPLTVVADDFSADAVKMIVITGGEALWS